MLYMNFGTRNISINKIKKFLPYELYSLVSETDDKLVNK